MLTKQRCVLKQKILQANKTRDMIMFKIFREIVNSMCIKSKHLQM